MQGLTLLDQEEHDAVVIIRASRLFQASLHCVFCLNSWAWKTGWQCQSHKSSVRIKKEKQCMEKSLILNVSRNTFPSEVFHLTVAFVNYTFSSSPSLACNFQSSVISFSVSSTQLKSRTKMILQSCSALEIFKHLHCHQMHGWHLLIFGPWQ